MRSLRALRIAIALALAAATARAETPVEAPVEAPVETTPAPSRFRSAEDGWLDVSGFLDEKYGFLPIAVPITEPAVGYGVATVLAFLSQPIGETRDGFGRPDISLVGGLGTANGTWGALAGDIRHWLDDRLQTQVGLTHVSVNLDFHGIGRDDRLHDDPLHPTT